MYDPGDAFLLFPRSDLYDTALLISVLDYFPHKRNQTSSLFRKEISAEELTSYIFVKCLNKLINSCRINRLIKQSQTKIHLGQMSCVVNTGVF